MKGVNVQHKALKWINQPHYFCVILRPAYLYAMSALPIFYQESLFTAGAMLALDEDTARHVVQVLRMGEGERLELANGKGVSAHCVIMETGKKRCTVRIEQLKEIAPSAPVMHLAIAFTKNTSRNEWLLEKATELGVQRITPVIATRTERERFRYDRLKGILVSAMMQSQQYWLPQLDEPMPLHAVLDEQNDAQIAIAHCMDELPRKSFSEVLEQGRNVLLFIGPEGDFTEEEVNLANAQGAVGVTLGNTRLRTETAAMAACALFHLVNS